MADELNIIEKANKVLTFRKYIREECRKKHLEYPSDEKIAEYIADGCSYDVRDFMMEYEGKYGVFKDPFVDFKNAILEYDWTTTPTDEEMRSYVAENGYNVKGFLQKRTIESYSPLEKATLLATLKLADFELVLLWNKFIEESARYGEDSYIYDLQYSKDVNFINNNFPNDKKAEITRLVRNAKLHGKDIRYIQWFNLNGDDDKIHVKDDIKGIIIAYWSDIFERIIGYPLCYNSLIHDQFSHDYFEDVFYPCMYGELGYKFDERDGSVTYCLKNS